MNYLSRQHSRATLILILITFASRFVFKYILGLTFDYQHLFIAWHIFDPELLTSRLGESIWYLHSQPPLFNLFTGLSMKWFPVHYPLILEYSFILAGLLQTLALYYCLFRLTNRYIPSLVIAGLFAISPSFILYENLYLYTFLGMCGLSVSAFFLIRFLLTEKTRWAVLLFSSLALLTLTISMFHLVWMALTLLLLIFLYRRLWHKIILAGAVPLLLATAWYGKNKILFDHFTASTWMGMNISRIMLFDGKNAPGLDNLSDTTRYIAEKGSFKCLDEYQPYLPKVTQYTNIPALQQTVKFNGVCNYNNYQYIFVSDQLKKASFAAVKADPLQYLRRCVTSSMLYFAPASIYFHLDSNRSKITGYDRVFNAGKLRIYKDYIYTSNIILMLAYAVVFATLFRRIRRHYRQRKGFSWQDAVMIYAAFHIVFFMMTGNMLEIAENMRFRFQVIPLFLMMGMYCLYYPRKHPSIPPEKS